VLSFRLWDRWDEEIVEGQDTFLGSERPSLLSPHNWVDDYPYIYVDGVFYYYP